MNVIEVVWLLIQVGAGLIRDAIYVTIGWDKNKIDHKADFGVDNEFRPRRRLSGSRNYSKNERVFFTRKDKIVTSS